MISHFFTAPVFRCSRGVSILFHHEDGIPDVRDHPTPSFRAVAACFMRIQSRIATATMSPEIFLVFGNTELFNSFSRVAANAPPLPSASPPKGGDEFFAAAAGSQFFFTMKTVYLMYETIPPPSFRAVAACFMRIQSRIATATMSREIFLVFGNTGLFKTPQSPAALLSAPLHRKRSPSPLKRGGWGALQRQSRGASMFHPTLSR